MSAIMKEFTCIICPNGCEMEALLDADTILSLDGARCKRGREYVEQELHDPRRNIASSVLVDGGALPLASVRLTAPIPRDQIFAVMEQIQKIRLRAPVAPGQIVIENVLGLGSDVIATKWVKQI